MRASPLLVLSICAAALAAQDAAAPPNGDFESGATGWKLPRGATIASEGGNHFLHLAEPGTVGAVEVPVPAGATLVTVSMRVRATGVVLGAQAWQDVRVACERHGADGKLIGYGPSPHVGAGTIGWTTVSESEELPVGTTVVQLAPSIMAKAGTADFDDIAVVFGAKPGPAAAPAGDAQAPAGAARWSDTKAVATSPLRGEMPLDGAWRFAPTGAKEAPELGWGWIAVPASWREERSLLARGQGALWSSFNRDTLRGAWYEREITVPAAWKGRAVLLDVARVSTDATVYLDGQRCGEIGWPEGSVDLSAAIKPGTTQRLRLHVVAALAQSEVMVLMGDLPGQTAMAKAELHTGGLTGTVRLLSRPPGAHIEDAFVRTSVRRGELAFDLELADVAAPGDVAIEAVIAGVDGVEAKRFTAKVAAKAGERQTVSVAWPWADAKRWDVGQPNLYVATIGARGAGIADAYPQRFGFRECWVDGRKLMLNGSEWRVRPMLREPSTPELAREALARGSNFCELWPEDPWYRSAKGYEAAYAVADEAGLPINGVTPHMGWHGTNIMSPDRLASYRDACARLMRRARNHPAIVFWGTSGNMTGGSLDPANVGRRQASGEEESKRAQNDYKNTTARAQAGIDIHHQLDPTRPVFIHNGGANGDLYTINHYLVAIPLQEREEWLSTYVEQGDMPLMIVEFGTPLSFDYMRGRKGFTLAVQSEPLFSEFLAAELGAAAYREETAAYRKVIREYFIKDQAYRWMHGMKDFFRLPAFLEVQERFITNTWRSWRTMGMTGGMIPWDDGYFAFDGQITRAGTAMKAVNAPTLAWICGAAGTGDRAAFTAKDHSFAAGTHVAKRVALLNDSRAPLPWSLTWRATLGGRELAAGRAQGALAVAETAFAPLAFDLPATLGAPKTDGEITIEARIGDAEHRDRFAFRAFAPLAPATGEVLVHDPAGRTSALLQQLGYRTVPWTGAADAGRLLVIGRGALADAKPLPGDLAAFIRAGGRAIIQAQDPQHVREQRGLRVSYKASRRVFLADPGNPAVAGLDAEDLRDWSGQGTLVEPKPDYVHGSGPDVALEPATGLPATGWRWGLRGTVATGAPEKPHRTGWRPILECEFDLAYSPLMELDLGRGRALWCQLDLEDHAAHDPAAARLAHQILEYARTAPLAPRVAAVYLGGDRGAALLDQAGLTYQRATALPAAGLAVIGSDADVDRAALEAFATSGGRVLVLPRAQADAGLGLRLVKRDDHLGSLAPPAWPECRGLSASDLRTRTECPAWVIADGAESGADGLLGRRTLGSGTILFCQVDPDRFDADRRTYLRFSRWRSTRALAQVLANLGGAFASDERVFTAQGSQGAMYSPDYRADWDLGDEPARYYNW
jgi:beta-galactosidase